MELTEEPKGRIRRNRERALEIKRKRNEELVSAKERGGGGGMSQGEDVTSLKKQKVNGGSGCLKENENKEEEDVVLEDFEVGASPFVSKREAVHLYCLPEGTLAVCTFVERENPRNKAWAPLKLFKRSEIRRRARERYGGFEGLIEERRKRAERRFKKDLKAAEDIFK
mmetsp:Transcript_6019/g.10977  ORF Transcript_6019/g.10977 Transcript_6019/m.10977 type:complete len:168 (-) Transcript_6019:26-529(-)|eukprot:CAMPEP_0202481096 /NCGR_PEP_ID=MMETSP1361-20130828/826_1 /ASSEMBLY_ACC=CAM_ASM_000849 /TAXON_ID=210615 /ORGANISM="Staurosira complex sp., Strain CCMP2646" /LENGTH=167 /DNA_ID=CAMNT_0049108589 /DNA_START=273 /DNA_END=776 /DNA_ORIENTATION=-